MQVSAANNSSPARSIESTVPAAPAPAPAALPQDNVDLRRVAALLTMLENKPEIRPEVLARGRALAADPTYPSPQVIDKLSRLIVSDNR